MTTRLRIITAVACTLAVIGGIWGVYKRSQASGPAKANAYASERPSWEPGYMPPAGTTVIGPFTSSAFMHSEAEDTP